MKGRFPVVMMTLIFVLVGVFASAEAAEVNRIAKEELKGLIGNQDVVILDVRTSISREADGKVLQITGAIREEPDKADAWMAKYPKDKTLVFYCA